MANVALVGGSHGLLFAWFSSGTVNTLTAALIVSSSCRQQHVCIRSISVKPRRSRKSFVEAYSYNKGSAVSFATFGHKHVPISIPGSSSRLCVDVLEKKCMLHVLFVFWYGRVALPLSSTCTKSRISTNRSGISAATAPHCR